jgi:hypothetical protein
MKPLTGFFISTVAPGITAPEGSVTVPFTIELPVVCAKELNAFSIRTEESTAAADKYLKESGITPLQENG